MGWSNVCVEAFCFGEKDENNNYPCGQRYPSDFCLGGGQSERCPHFAWSKSSERDSAQFIPLYLILWDRIGIWWDELYWNIRWIFWDQLWFNKRKVKEFFNSISLVSSKEFPELLELGKEQENNKVEFEKWIIKAKNEKV